MLFAAQPSWWVEEDTKIIAEGREENNFGPANLGQLKHVAKQAKKHLDDNLVGGSGMAVNSLVATFVTSTNPEDVAANYAPLNIGQLKAVAKPFYDRLLSAGYGTKANLIAHGYSGSWAYDYPWNPATPVSENYAPANVGQLKLVFSFDLTGTDSDSDGLPDWWELGAYGDLDSDGTGDWDGDGIGDAAEFTAGGNASDYYSQGATTITPYLTILGGNGQFGLPNQFLPNPLSLEVRSGSSTGSLLNNAPVTYTVTSGSGTLATLFGGTVTSATLTVRTGTNGQTAAYYKQATAINSAIVAQASSVTTSFTEHATGANGLVARWPFNEGTGTIAADAIGLSASGTLKNSVAWVDGFDGAKAVGFSGTNHVTMGNPTNESLDFGTGSFSITAWVKYSDATMAPGESYQRIVSKGHKGWNGGYLLAIDDEGQIVGGVGTTQTGTSSETLLFSSTNAFNDDAWHHVALVIDSFSKIARLYVDGMSQGVQRKSGSGGVETSEGVSFYFLNHLFSTNGNIGFSVGGYNGSEELLKGVVDDVRVYRRALNLAEVLNLYNIDVDSDELPDRWEGKYMGGIAGDPNADVDNDGLTNWEEYYFGADPTKSDSDEDGMPDGWEISHGMNPLDGDDASADADGDGLTNLQEYEQESDPNDYYSQGSTTIAPVISIAGGNGQMGNTGRYLAEALTVEVRSGSSTGVLLGNAPVTFTVDEGGGVLATTFGGTNTSGVLEVRTGTNGIGEAWYKQGEDDAVESLILVQTGTATPVEFTAFTVDLVGHWKMDEGTGTLAIDAGPFEFTGTLTSSPTWAERYVGENALTFSGTSQYVQVGSGTSTVLDFEDTGFSVVAWVKTGTDIQAGRIVSKGNEAANTGYFMGINALGQVETSLGTTATGTASETVQIKTTGTFADDSWHQVVTVYDRENTTARIYVDGSARVIAKEAGTGGTINVSGSTAIDYPTLENLSGNRSLVPLTIASESGTAAYFKGSLDDVKIYRKPLNASEVAALYQGDGPLLAFSQTVTIAEDTLGTITLKHQGGGNTAAVCSVVDEPTDGDTEIEGSVLKFYPDAHFSGTNTLTYSVEKGGRTAEAGVTIIVTPVNDPPLVSVGGGRSIAMSGSTATLVLSGTVTDVDTESEDIQLTWIKASGSGTVTFTGTNPLAATAAFNAAGEYVLRLLAHDGTSLRSDSLVVTVNSSSTSLPTIAMEEPDNNEAYDFEEAIALKAEATAGSGRSVSKVEFFEGSRKIGEDATPDATSGLYEFAWAPPRLGAYRISARVTDSAGSQVFSGAIQARVTEAGWFTDSGLEAGNEGYAGSGGTSGVNAGTSTGPQGDFGPGTGGNGGGGASGGGGDGFGNPHGTDLENLDTDGDGISDSVELNELGTLPDEEDSDGDDVPDGEDAVPYNNVMRVKAAPEASYAIVDLGLTSEVGVPRGINDKADVLLINQTTTPQLALWTSGSLAAISTSFVGASGPLLDGTVYFWGPEIYEDWIGTESGHTKIIDSRKNEFFSWQKGGSAVPQGLGNDHLLIQWYSYFPTVTRQEILPDQLDSIMETQFNIEFLKLKSRASIVFGSPIYYGYTLQEKWASIVWVNDNHDFGYRGAKNTFMDRWEVEVALNGAANSTLVGSGTSVINKDSDFYYSQRQWNEATEADVYTYYDEYDGKASGKFFKNTDGDIIILKHVNSIGPSWGSIGSASVEGAFMNNQLIPGCKAFRDLTSRISPEGPYILGSTDSSKALWCYDGGKYGSIVLKDTGTFASVDSSVPERAISKSLVIPFGDRIWRNGRVRKLSEISGFASSGTAGWTDPNVTQVSPNNNLLIGSAKKDGVQHTVLLVPLEIVPDDGMNDVVGSMTPSTRGVRGERHFVSPRIGSAIPQDYVVLKAGIFDSQWFEENLEWQGGEAIPENPTKRRVPRRNVGKNVIKLISKSTGAEVARLNVWIVWSTGAIVRSGVGIFYMSSDQIMQDGQTHAAVANLACGRRDEDRMVFEFGILPAEICDLNQDVPDFRGEKIVDPPGGVNPANPDEHLKNSALFRWDQTRAMQMRLKNPRIIASQFHSGFVLHDNMALMDGQPIADKILVQFPTDDSEGNDDGQESGWNPYVAEKTGVSYLDHEKGKIRSSDKPAAGVPNLFQNGDVYLMEYNFKEFIRLNIGNRWYRISDHIKWRLNFRVKKIDGELKNDGSYIGGPEL